jgi:hypothetical protein
VSAVKSKTATASNFRRMTLVDLFRECGRLRRVAYAKQKQEEKKSIDAIPFRKRGRTRSLVERSLLDADPFA